MVSYKKNQIKFITNTLFGTLLRGGSYTRMAMAGPQGTPWVLLVLSFVPCHIPYGMKQSRIINVMESYNSHFIH